jgi:hypothetical protein
MITFREQLAKNETPVESILHSKETISADILDSPCSVLETGPLGALYCISTPLGDNFYTELPSHALFFYSVTELLEILPKHTLQNPGYSAT